MKYRIPLFFILVISCLLVAGQSSMRVDAKVDIENRIIQISQEITYKNTSKQILQEIYLTDWANSFRDKQTPLAQRFEEEFQRNFHYAKGDERGNTQVFSITKHNQDILNWSRPDQHPDIIKIELNKPLFPKEEVSIKLRYRIKVPKDKFTRYGSAKNGLKLRYWLILPSVFQDGEWQFYSNKDLNDLYVHPYDIDLNLEIPKGYLVVSDFTKVGENILAHTNQFRFSENNQVDTKLHIINTTNFKTIETDKLNIITNVEDDGLRPEMKALIIDRITHYLDHRLGEFPHDNLMISEEDYLSNPVYGLNQLPSFIRPFPDGFQYDIKLLKTITRSYLENTLILNPRKESWLNEGIITYLLMDYVEQFYKNTKLLGSFSEIVGIRWFHAADLEFNDRYPLLYLNMARVNLNQPLNEENDNLIKFNKNIANPYKAGVGLNYLKDYLQDDEVINKSIKDFYAQNRLKPTTTANFKKIISNKTNKDTDWFFEEYVGNNIHIDFKISKVKKEGDSLRVTIKNKTGKKIPISLYGIKDKDIVSKTWVDQFVEEKTVTISAKNIERLALNYEAVIPEFNQRDNYKKVTTWLDKPIQLRLLLDIEDPYYQQLFLIPEFDYNLYDGFTIGPKLYNKTVLARNLNYKIAPKYGFKSGAVLGSASISYSKQYQNQELYGVRFGLSGTRFSYANDLYYHKVSPYLSIGFRNKDLRSNEKQSISIRSINVFRDRDVSNTIDEPDYSVLNARYHFSDRNFADYFTGTFDYQVAKKFSKVSVTSKWRKLFLNNRQIELRFFAGAFLFNDAKDSDYFSFALDRPTDYLFDYNYYGRSEDQGLFSQQYIEAEGGFKSQLQPAFANQWLTSLNGSFTLWNWIHAYGDVGFVKNKGSKAEFLYDTGIRVSLVQDYFELFFPVYSNLGWEVAQPDYDQKIRFIVSLDFNTLIKLFKRRWY
ncbi:metalloprotease [Mesonia ostreae]|uniref:Metalloprotease n=1 Tax=Mesonia ostreae TaxID=861110 RepID=A0ABU2KKE3_9FLAO|nr:metalloprotease [Mesonia ostreae]MDT0295133.1 metalloprotease [Mesonia ostreae]